ncbi:MAG: FHA domain-containing protein [Gemmataceae bacterium]
MSFRLFIYYCALCGGWAAFLVWLLVQATGLSQMSSIYLRAFVIGGLLGGAVAAAVGFIDSLLSVTGIQRLVRTLVCAGLGFAGGGVGGLVGQVLNDQVGIPLFVGWMLAGVLIGASIGAYDVLQALSAKQGLQGTFRKMTNGVLGGLLGGLIGGLPFTFLATSSTLSRSGLTISLVILGVCIGLMIGLAQVILKEAWLKVEEGFRSGRELLLTREETTIGRAETCDLGLFGDNTIQKVHARIVQKNNRYFLSQVGDEGETLLNDEKVGSKPVALRAGDGIRIGKSLLRFGERQKKK